MATQKIIRRMRILEYVGPEDWVVGVTENKTRYVDGIQQFGQGKFIREYLSAPEEIPQETKEI